MKDLYGLRMEDIENLKQMGHLDKDTVVCNDGKSIIDESPLYAVTFDTSEQRYKAYNVIFGKTKPEGKNMDWRDRVQKRIEAVVIGLDWNTIKEIFEDRADTLTHQIYQEKIYWNCIFDNNICVSVEFAFEET